ncbi:MAG: ribosome silencing factor [Aeriscardovia sp.]|nr:ribosome silencing factor [Aeriscardovia sp.]
MSMNEDSMQCITVAANAANDMKATNIVAIDVSDSLALTEAFLIASGSNPRQIIAISEEIEKRIFLQFHRKPFSREGISEAQWILLDFGDFVIHVMDTEARDFYGLEKLWEDCPRLEIKLENPEETE